MKLNKLALIALSLGLTFTSCTSDDDGLMTVAPLGDYENGIVVSNEGNFFQGNASISYVSSDFATVENNVFSNVNDQLLGDTAQSMTFYGDYAYIIVNVSQKIEVVNRYTFQSVATIESGISNPRFMVVANGKGYVTNWGDGSSPTDDYIAIIDLATNSIEGTISVSEGPEQIIANENSLYVSHKGGWGDSNLVSVVNIASQVVSTVIVSDKPDELTFDADGNVLVLCEGLEIYNDDYSEVIDHTLASITKIDVTNNTVLSNLYFAFGTHPRLFTYNEGNAYYYVSGEVFKIEGAATGLPAEGILTQELYGSLVVSNNRLYGTNSDFLAGTGELVVYDLATNALLVEKELSVGASKIYFN